jgi:hypothetical protein
MTPTASPPDTPLVIPNPDAIRAAIDAADERARLLRRLLRLALRLRVHLTTADRLTPPAADRQGVYGG